MLHRGSLSRLPLFLFLFAVPSMVFAEGGAVGVWSLELDFNGRAVPVELAIWHEDGSLEGSWEGPRGKSDLADVAFTGDKLTFVREVELQGQAFGLKFEGTVAGDELTGSFSTPQGSMAVAGTRSAGRPTTETEETVVVSQLAASEAEEFLGHWAVDADFEGQKMEISLEITEHDGRVAALIVSPQGEQAVERIERTGDGLRFEFDSPFGPLVLLAQVDGDDFTGTFGDTAGAFSTALTGSRSDAADFENRRQVGGFFGGRPSTVLTLGGKKITLFYAEPPAVSPAFEQIAGATPGQVVALTDYAAFKLLTELDLKFGEVTVAAGNVHDSYPGVYSLWLKRVESGWHLVFNSQADIWGTMHDPEADVAEVPLLHASTDAEIEKLTLELKESGDGGELELAWGEHRWTASFKTAL